MNSIELMEQQHAEAVMLLSVLALDPPAAALLVNSKARAEGT